MAPASFVGSHWYILKKNHIVILNKHLKMFFYAKQRDYWMLADSCPALQTQWIWKIYNDSLPVLWSFFFHSTLSLSLSRPKFKWIWTNLYFDGCRWLGSSSSVCYISIPSKPLYLKATLRDIEILKGFPIFAFPFSSKGFLTFSLTLDVTLKMDVVGGGLNYDS